MDAVGARRGGSAVSRRVARTPARVALSVAAFSALSALPLAALAGSSGVCAAAARALPQAFALHPLAVAANRALGGGLAWPAAADGGSLERVLPLSAAWLERQRAGMASGGCAGTPGTRIVNRGSIDVQADAHLGQFDPSLSLATGADVTETLTLSAKAIGIEAGPKVDSIVNSGTVHATASASLDTVAVTLTLAETSHATTTTTLEAVAVGIAAGSASHGGKGHAGGGGQAADSILNDGSVVAEASASIVDVGVTVSAANFATADGSLTLSANATGIRAGTTTDSIVNNGALTATATTSLTQVDVSATFLGLSIVDRGPNDASTSLNANATGIDAAAAKGGVSIGGTGSVTATAQSFVNATGVSVSSEGVDASVPSLFSGPIATVGISAESAATGVRSGRGDDGVALTGPVTVQSGATAQQQSVDVGVSVFNLHVPTPGFSVVGAGTKADARATGIETKEGDDQVSNAGAMTVNANAKSSTAVALVSLGDLAIDLAPNLPSLPLSYSVLVADAISETRAHAVGIDAGEGDDGVLNRAGATLTVGATANSGTVDASARAGLKFEDKKTPDPNPSSSSSISAEFGVSLARASIDAASTAIGMDGGAGRDTLVNDGTLGATATTGTYGVSVRVDLMGPLDFDQGPNPSLLGSGAASDTSNSAGATATAMAGGAGDDTLVNRGKASATASADALNVTAGIGLKMEKNGVLAGVSLVDSDASATATAVGLDGGGGADRIENLGQVDATARAGATSVSVNVEVQAVSDKGVAASVSVLDADTTATASAVGLRSGEATQGHDHDKGGASNDGKSCGAAATPSHCKPAPAGIVNAGTVNVDADATTAAVNATVHADVTSKGAVAGVALSDTSATARAAATGIEGNAAGERIANEGTLGLTATTQAVAVGVNLTVESAATGLAAGAALTRSAVDASASATGIAGAAGDDIILNTGTITTALRNVQATATTVSVGLEAKVVSKQGAAIGAALTDTHATAVASATGVDGGAGDDTLVNRGAVTLDGVGADTTAVGVALDLALAKQGFSATAALARSDSTSSASATGLAGGSGDDTLVNERDITLRRVRSDGNAVSVGLDISGAQDGLVIGAALADAGATATAAATGLAGGSGRDTLANAGRITVDAVTAESDSVDVGVDIKIAKNGLGIGAALVKSGVNSSADAAGLDGGAEQDRLFNDGEIELRAVSAKADAVGVSVGLVGSANGLSIAAGLADGSSTASATARALAGGSGDDLAVNRGRIVIDDVNAGGNATAVSVGLAGTNNGIAASVTLADSSASAIAQAAGIDGGEGHDTLWSEGGITIGKVKADAGAVTADVSLSGSLSAGVAAGAALGRSAATAEARVAGLDGGSGNDLVASRGETGLLVDDVAATASAAGVSVQLGVVSNGAAIGAALVDTSTTARTTVAGLQGGAGDDAVLNAGALTLRNLKAEASAVSVGVGVDAALTAGVAGGLAWVDGKGTAALQVAGLAGGAGDDRLFNEGSVTVSNAEALAHATDASVTLNISLAGAAGGASIANTSANAMATVKGLDGGSGDDLLFNRGPVDVRGRAAADSLGVSVSLNVALGVAAGATITDASSTAQADVAGLDAGEGRDTMFNEGTVQAQAEAVASGTSVSIVVPNIFGGYAAAKLSTSATASAVGLRDADSAAPASCGHGKHKTTGQGGPSCDHERKDGEHATIANRAGVTATATASSTGTSVGGALFGYSLGDTSNSAAAVAAGIQAGARDDAILNEATLAATGGATASGLGVNVSVLGATTGDASTVATVQASGIDSGAGDDSVDNRAGIVATARSSASALVVAVGLAGSATISGDTDAAKTATATAVGIATGDGDDRIANSGSVTVDAGRAALRPDDARDGRCTAEAGGACASSSGVAVELAGSGRVDASTNAIALGTGLDGGRGDDQVENSGSLRVDALARARADGVGVVLGGVDHVNASTLVSTTASGMRGDVGADRLTNRGTIEVMAAADTFAANTSVVIGGKATAEGNTQALTAAVGMDGGAGDDALGNAGAVTVAADASAGVSGTSFAFAGQAPAVATLGAGATAVGLGGGGGADRLHNEGAVKATANARVSVTGGATAIFGGASAGSNVTATATATGIDAGDESDLVHQRGTLEVTAAATLGANSTSFALGNASSGDVLFALSQATGIAAGSGDNLVLNDGRLLVKATATLAATGGASTVFGNTRTTATVTARSAATGIAAGDGGDTLVNDIDGAIDVTAALDAGAVAGVEAGRLFVDGSARSSVSAQASAIGIDAGAGDNLVVLKGSLAARVSGSASASSGSNADFLSIDSDSVGEAGVALTRAAAVGLQAGDGRDRIANLGTLTASAAPSVSAAAGAEGGGIFDNDADAVATALVRDVIAIGIDAGAGDNEVLNRGTISATAAPKASAVASSNAHWFSDAGAGAQAQIHDTLAVGIASRGGASTVVNDGRIEVRADAQAQAAANPSPGGAGGVDFAYTIADVRNTQAIGIWSGGGASTLVNGGSIDVTMSAGALGRADGSAYGLRVDGAGEVENEGGLKVRGDASALGAASVQAFGVALAGVVGADSRVINKGSIDVASTALGVLGSAYAESDGLKLGDGRNDVHNRGDVIARAEATGFFLFGQAQAFAVGIAAGDGGNRIVNAGHIVVDTVSSRDGQSYGIRSGSGDDQIVNLGSIVATRTLGGTTSAGIAIDAGAGNDTVLLGDGSVTRGDIDLGAGTDVLLMQGAPVFEGSVIDDGSRLTLALAGSGSFGGTLPAAVIRKQGEGTFALASLPSAQRLEVQGGTLEIGSDYRFLGDGQFAATVNGDGSHGRLHVRGQAQLDGGLRVERGTGPFVNGSRYEVLRADGGFAAGSGFERVELPESTRLLSFASTQAEGSVSVTAEVKRFTTAALGTDAQAVARQLDRVLPTVRGDLREALGSIQRLTQDADFANAFASLSPVTHGQRTLASAASVDRFVQTIEQRIGGLQLAGREAGAARAVPVIVAANGNGGFWQRLEAAEQWQAKPYGVWLQAFAQRGDQDGSSDASGYRYELAGQALGADHRFDRSLSAGVAFGWVKNEFRSDVAGNRADLKSRLAALYGSYAVEDFYATATLSAGSTSHDGQRSIVVGATSTPVTSRHDAKLLSATLGAGLPRRAGDGWLDPFVNLRYTRVKEDAFTENGSGAALAVDARSTRTLLSELGLRWTQPFTVSGNARLMPEASAAWLHDFGHGSRLVQAAYVDAPDAGFAVEGQRIERNGLRLGLGVTYRSSGGLSSVLRYAAEIRPGYRAHGLVGELRYEF